jgi:hypothetical protein
VNTTTNHGAAIPLPEKPPSKSQLVQRALRAYRNANPGRIWVVWAYDVENAIIEEEREMMRLTVKAIELKPPQDGSVKAKNVTFVTDRRIPAGMVYFMSHDPSYGLENPHLTDQAVVDYIGNLATKVLHP